MTVPGAGARAPSHGVARRGTGRQPYVLQHFLSATGRRHKRHQGDISLFSHWWFLLPWAPPYQSGLLPALATQSAQGQTSWRAFLVDWNPRESLMTVTDTDFSTDTQ